MARSILEHVRCPPGRHMMGGIPIGETYGTREDVSALPLPFPFPATAGGERNR